MIILKKFLFCATRIWFRIFNSIEVEGLHKIPSGGPLIIACNHIALSDPPALMAFSALIRDINVIAKKELFLLPVIGWVIRNCGAISIDRHKEGGDVSALRSAINVLKKNGCLIIFPEGTRAKGKHVKPKLGIALLADKTGAKVLCARIFNSENFAKLGRIKIKYGRLLSFEYSGGLDIKQAYSDFSDLVMKEIYSIT